MKSVAPRLWFAAAITVLLSAGLVWRWVNLQVDQFEHFSKEARDNQIQLRPIEPPRGRIFDGRGRELAGNTTAYSLQVGSDFAGEVLGKLDVLTAAIAVPDGAVKKLQNAVASKVYKGQLVLRERLDKNEIANFLAVQFLFPEIILQAELARRYPYRDSAGHVVGYVGRLNEQDKKRLKKEGLIKLYRDSKFIGKTGVELINERVLRGRLGLQEAQIDAHGRILKRRVLSQPTAGRDVTLSIDMELQQLAESLLHGERGAVVMMNAQNGAVLALASSPRFDINYFVFGISSEAWKKLNDSDDKPLIHRAIYGQYAPGSTIKPFSALAALDNGWINKEYIYHSVGYFKLSAKHIFHDWKKGGHGKVDVVKSIVRSVNSFYYQLGHDVGIDEMKRGLSLFGFGQKTGIDLNNEKSGVLPSSEWKQKTLSQPWFPGDTIAVAVGQGYLQVTPLQMARAMAAIANRGRLLKPRLAKLSAVESSAIQQSPAFLQHAKIVQDALSQVTQPGGTAARVGRNSVYGIAGKTGTAQVTKLKLNADGSRIKNKDLPKHLRDHAWFVGYAPADNPQVSIAVIVENGGSGGKTAGPIARQLLDRYLLEGGFLPAANSLENKSDNENNGAQNDGDLLEG